MKKADYPRKTNQTVSYQDILVAVLGVSPAILTETLWCLARENPPLFPEKILVLTTRRGRDRLQETLFQRGELTRLRDSLVNNHLDPGDRWHFGMASDCIRLFPSPDGSHDLEDITTSQESQAAADFLFRTLRDLTSDPRSRIIASLAGGRKTLGALLSSSMVLLGRRQDRLCHVMVSPPFDSPLLNPMFYFPEEGRQHRLQGTEQIFYSDQARLELSDVPFVRVRGWYEQEYRNMVPSYMSMVRRVQELAPDPDQYPVITIDMSAGSLCVDEKDAALSPGEFALFTVLYQRAKQGGGRIHSWNDISGEMEQLHADLKAPLHQAWVHDFREKRFVIKEDARKLASSLRRKLTALLPEVSMVDCLVPTPKTYAQGCYPASRIHILNYAGKRIR